MTQDRGAFAPDEKLTCYCGFDFGTGADRTVRLLVEHMSKALSVEIEVKNVTDGHKGLEGVTATKALIDAPPDGRTLFITPGAIVAANQHILRDPPFDLTRDLQAFGSFQRPPNTLLVAPDSPYETLDQLTEAMMAKGASAKYGVPNGSVVRVVAALYRKLSGVPTQEVVYHASLDVIRDLNDGVLEFGFSNNVMSVLQEEMGRVRILAVHAPESFDIGKDRHSFSEYGYKIEVDGWWAGFVPKSTPEPLVEALSAAMEKASRTPELQAFFRDTIAEPLIHRHQDAQAYFLAQIVAWENHVYTAEIAKQELPEGFTKSSSSPARL